MSATVDPGTLLKYFADGAGMAVLEKPSRIDSRPHAITDIFLDQLDEIPKSKFHFSEEILLSSDRCLDPSILANRNIGIEVQRAHAGIAQHKI